jgi:hypothetical protein
MSKPITNLPASIHDRLLNTAKNRMRPFNDLLQYYVIERFLYRLSLSKYANQFVLKGAMAIIQMDATFPRATKDIDLLGVIDNSVPFLEKAFKEICAIRVEDDGLVFIPESVVGAPIKANDEYPGVRVEIKANFGNSLISLQVDIGVADLVFPIARKKTYPSLLGHKGFKIKVYEPETMLAEKIQTLVHKGKVNSRMKDIYDIWWIASNRQIKGLTLAKAIKTTFTNRHTPLPGTLSFLEDGYYSQRQMIAWQSMVKRIRSSEVFPDLVPTLEQLKPFLVPLMEALFQNIQFDQTWDPKNEWDWK